MSRKLLLVALAFGMVGFTIQVQAQETRVRDLPIPDGATDVSYMKRRGDVRFQVPTDFKTTGNYYGKTLAEQKWTKTGKDNLQSNFWVQKFAKNTLSLEVRVDSRGGGSEVRLTPSGLMWDEGDQPTPKDLPLPKETTEVARAKQKAKAAEVAAREQQKKEMAGQPLELPKRKDRPHQGIENLPKLPNHATIVMDGKTYTLSNVIAYEVFEDGEWSTKVVATQRPVKQQSLLANLKQTGTDKSADESSLSWPQPFVSITLDEDDKPKRLNLQADKTPGNGTGSDLSGDALVENGRARGSVQLKEPGSFFDKVYTAEISFDVPLLTRQSSPAKLLVDAPKLANSGTLKMGDKTYNLSNVVAYAMKQFDKPMTTIVLSEKPLNMTKLTAALGKKSADDYFEFTAQVKLVVDAEDNVNSTQIWADNASISGNNENASEIVIEDGRARGTAKMLTPGEFFNKQYSFEVSFDTVVLGATITNSSPPNAPVEGLVADSHNGLPFPEGGEGYQSEGSNFRKQTSKTVPANLKSVIDFYRRELTAPAWTEIKEAAKIEPTSASLSFTGPDGSMLVQLTSEGDKTAIALISRDAQGAKAAGVLPGNGKGRLLVGNASEEAAAVTINKKAYTVAAGAGAEDPTSGLNFEVSPGKFVVEVKLPDQAANTETLKVGTDETWGVVILPTGTCLSIQLY
ncbi:MAG: hypothetical protein KF752_06195 [Pirellulaceae bacterium]|nr:hypothetical protein [Pirellulaceae bacterium]